MTRLRRGVAILVASFLVGGCQATPPTSPTGNDPTPAPPSSAPASPSATVSASPSASAVVGPGEPWIVYQGAPLGLSLTRTDGTGTHVILGPPGDQLHPDWSPDGSRIAYVQTSETASSIWITDPLGADPKPMLGEDPPDMSGLFWDNPSWSPDGSTIAAVAYEGNPNALLPTRSFLALVDVASGAVTVASEFVSADGALHSFPRWSPDGDALVIAKDRFDGDQNLGAEIAITRRTGERWSEPKPITDMVTGGPRVDWHPSDDLIVYCTNDVGGVQVTDDPSELFTIRSDGTGLTQITQYGSGGERASQPSWTSDGRIIFTYITGDQDDQLNVAFIDADGANREIVIGPDLVGIGNRPHPRLRPTG